MGKRKCKQCGFRKPVEDGYIPPGSLSFFCDISHTIAWSMTNKQKGKEIARKIQAKADAIRRKEARPISKLKSDAQAAVNEYVRLRDIQDGCITCDKGPNWHGQWHASHYYSRGHSSFLRFNLWNIHKSCSRCNDHLAGNISNYKPAIIIKIGADRVEFLELNRTAKAEYSREYLERITRIFRKRCRIVKKRLE